MKLRLQILQSLLGMLTLCVLLLAPVHALDYEVSIPEYKANSGQTLRVPVSVNDACGLAHIRLQINYDSQVATLTEVSAGSLGENFELMTTMDDGYVTIDGVRGENLICGTGVFAWLDFHLNAGATVDNYTDLSVAMLEAGDQTGVKDLSVSNSFTAINGSIQLSLDPNIDNSGNQLPDWWENASGLDPYSTLADGDEEQDGLTNLMEYAQGGDPTKNDAADIRPKLILDASNYAQFSFRRRRDDNQLSFNVHESADMQQWNLVDLGSRMVGAPNQLDDNIELITIRSQHPIDDIESPERLFMRLEVVRD